ncbi:hemolysin [Clostridium sp. Marseille-Q7071]
MWKSHIKFNGWEVKSNNEENDSTSDTRYKKVNIEDIPFL